jgi:hypothetical protein
MYRIYYDHREPHEDRDGPPTGDAARGVQVIVQDHPDVGWYTQSGGDYFVYRDGRWWSCDIAGLFDFLLDSGIVLFGRMVDKDEFTRIYGEALADRDLAEKTGFLPKRIKDRRP